ncbi:MAG: acetolactate synthase large subunit [Caldilineaceae bacterium]|nr:acetolactate synthase large subunit [Caldilineaceae bacterium]
MINGALSLIQTLVNGGVDTCFTNPGTSEMHFVAAVDKVPQMRTILCLFEGVCTGAADGYARMAGKPAATLLHLGPGLGNGFANLHNARRAHSAIVNIVGEHATYHLQYDAPLTSDIVSIAKPVSAWIHRCKSAEDVPSDAANAILAARGAPGQIATLILPGDCAWNQSGPPATVPTVSPPPTVDEAVIRTTAALLRNHKRTVLCVGGPAATERSVQLAARICQATGARLVAQRASARMKLGAGTPIYPRIPYAVPQALDLLKDTEQMILVGAPEPVAFFAYPGMPSRMSPPDAHLHTLATAAEDALAALDALAEEVGAPHEMGPVHQRLCPPLPTGALTAEKVWQALANLMPEESVIADESVTASFGAAKWMGGAHPHDWLPVMGGAIGQGIPVATGAAVACPNRKVINTQADGSAMYTVQGLWTQAREQLDVVTLLFSNRAYALLQGELQRVGADASCRKAQEMLDLSNPSIQWTSSAHGLGVEASRATTAEELNDQLAAALHKRGPHLIEAVL